MPSGRSRRLSDSLFGRGERTRNVTGIHGTDRLDQQEMRLLVCARAMFEAARNDEEVARSELNVPVSQLDRQAALQHEKEIVRVGVRMPDELTPNLDDLQLVVI